MPIYEYRRPDGSTFEVVQSFSDEALTSDPQTGVKVERVMHAPAVHFKGSGFYNTDYGRRNRGRDGANESSDGGSSESKSADDGAGVNGKAGADSGAGAKSQGAGSKSQGAGAKSQGAAVSATD
jgi:putative FmdB family regulatory protein